MAASIKHIIQIDSPVSFLPLKNMVSRKFKITFMAHIIFLLDSVAQKLSVDKIQGKSLALKALR